MSKILCISHIFPPSIDGGSRVIYKLGQYFQKQGDQVLYLSSDCSSTDDFTKSKYQKSKTLPNQIKLPTYHHLRRPLKFINLFLSQKSYLHQLLQIYQKGPIFRLLPFLKVTYQVLKFKPDLIVAGPLPTTTILYANFLKKITHAKLLVNASFHPTDPDFHRLPLIKALQSTDYIWTLTQYETNYFIKNFHIDTHKIILAGNGIDQSFLKNNQPSASKIPLFKGKTGLSGKGFTILFIGSFAAHKGLDTLIDSFSRLVKEGIKGRLVLAGQKTLFYPQIQKQISELPKNTKSRIKFIFDFPQKKLSQLIDKCDCLILPSKQESFGLVLIEAWARQKPVIVSDIPQLSELVFQTHGGLTFKLDNLSNLNQKISKLIKNPQFTQQLGKNGFKYVKNNYTWDIVGNKIREKIFSP